MNKIGRPLHASPEPSKAHVIIQHNQKDGRVISGKVVEYWKNGCSVNDIARLTGKSKLRVRTILQGQGIATGPTIDESKFMAWRKRRKTNAHPPFGYICYFGELIIEAREQKTLLLIKNLSKDGMNPNAIAEHLNAKNLKPRRAFKWNRNSVVLILRRSEESV